MPRSAGTKPGLCKVGAYAGQVQYYPVHVWEALLATGQIEAVEDEGATLAETATAPIPERREGGPLPDRPDDPEALPPGYSVEHGGGGYYQLSGPDGGIPGSSNGKHRGKDAAADAAWADFLEK